jgi:hypothetical protein
MYSGTEGRAFEPRQENQSNVVVGVYIFCLLLVVTLYINKRNIGYAQMVKKCLKMAMQISNA